MNIKQTINKTQKGKKKKEENLKEKIYNAKKKINK